MTTLAAARTGKRHLLIALVAALLVALAVFWYLTPNAAKDVSSTRTVAPELAARCPTTDAELRPWTSGDVTSRQSGTIPPGFLPKSVMVCNIDREGGDAQAEASYVVITTESPVSGDLVSALGLSDQKFWFDSRGACTADLESPLDLLLLDAQRHAIRPAVPLDPCGKVRPELRRAIGALQLVQTNRQTV